MRKYIKLFEEKEHDPKKIDLDILETINMFIKAKSFSELDLDFKESSTIKAKYDVMLITPFGEVPFYFKTAQYKNYEYAGGCPVKVFYTDFEKLYEIEIKAYDKYCDEDQGNYELEELMDFYKL